jgi:hypothetical protein
MECRSEFMVVKIRFGRGPVVMRKQGKNSRMAMLAASLLTLVSISCGALGLWRIGTDLDWAGDFVFSKGLLSHWQVWVGATIAVQYGAWRLTRYASLAREQDQPEIEEVSAEPAAQAAANI